MLPENAFISIGSNIDPEENLTLAIKGLGGVGRIVALSGVYQSPAVGATRQPDFLNAGALIATELDTAQIRRRLRAVETDLGRKRVEDKFAARTIDIDLCLYGNVVLNTAEITLPHPDIITCAYVAVPLAELAPEMLHPVTGESLVGIAAKLRGGTRLIRRLDVELGAEPLGKPPLAKRLQG